MEDFHDIILRNTRWKRIGTLTRPRPHEPVANGHFTTQPFLSPSTPRRQSLCSSYTTSLLPLFLFFTEIAETNWVTYYQPKKDEAVDLADSEWKVVSGATISTSANWYLQVDPGPGAICDIRVANAYHDTDAGYTSPMGSSCPTKFCDHPILPYIRYTFDYFFCIQTIYQLILYVADIGADAELWYHEPGAFMEHFCLYRFLNPRWQLMGTLTQPRPPESVASHGPFTQLSPSSSSTVSNLSLIPSSLFLPSSPPKFLQLVYIVVVTVMLRTVLVLGARHFNGRAAAVVVAKELQSGYNYNYEYIQPCRSRSGHESVYPLSTVVADIYALEGWRFIGG
ncbi:hypothetical protein D9758_011236 [Tetrapyrgos nigripes]|uniref:Uncharacterized protein n=1 Tax=Tetrapyrgos nigripes TaxID=182062 RepID=A0A8H5FZQ5_9AGAR|nr:hypothetical protein D9758_011236 [Tetrapyrgos nigripes]